MRHKDNTWMIESFKSLDASDNNCTALTPAPTCTAGFTAIQKQQITLLISSLSRPIVLPWLSVLWLQGVVLVFRDRKPSLHKNNTDRGVCDVWLNVFEFLVPFEGPSVQIRASFEGRQSGAAGAHKNQLLLRIAGGRVQGENDRLNILCCPHGSMSCSKKWKQEREGGNRGRGVRNDLKLMTLSGNDIDCRRRRSEMNEAACQRILLHFQSDTQTPSPSRSSSCYILPASPHLATWITFCLTRSPLAPGSTNGNRKGSSWCS